MRRIVTVSAPTRAVFIGIVDLEGGGFRPTLERVGVYGLGCGGPGLKRPAWGRDYPSPMSARAVPLPLQQLPNALTIGRLALIPVFVGLMLSADGGHSWPAGIVFGVAGVTDQIDGFLA